MVYMDVPCGNEKESESFVLTPSPMNIPTGMLVGAFRKQVKKVALKTGVSFARTVTVIRQPIICRGDGCMVISEDIDTSPGSSDARSYNARAVGCILPSLSKRVPTPDGCHVPVGCINNPESNEASNITSMSSAVTVGESFFITNRSPTSVWSGCRTIHRKPVEFILVGVSGVEFELIMKVFVRGTSIQGSSFAKTDTWKCGDGFGSNGLKLQTAAIPVARMKIQHTEIDTLGALKSCDR